VIRFNRSILPKMSGVWRLNDTAKSKYHVADVSIILQRERERESASSRKRRSIVGRAITNNWHRFLSLSLSLSPSHETDARNRPAVGVIDGVFGA